MFFPSLLICQRRLFAEKPDRMVESHMNACVAVGPLDQIGAYRGVARQPLVSIIRSTPNPAAKITQPGIFPALSRYRAYLGVRAFFRPAHGHILCPFSGEASHNPLLRIPGVKVVVGRQICTRRQYREKDPCGAAPPCLRAVLRMRTPLFWSVDLVGDTADLKPS